LVLTVLSPAIAGALELAKTGLAAQPQGEWDRALQLYNEALEAGDLPPATQARVLGLRANAYGVKGVHDKAGADFAAAMVLTPNDPAPYVGRSILDRQMADYASAMADASAAIALKPDYVLGYTNRGLAEFYAGRFAAATEDFAKSQGADPGEPDFVLWLHLSRARAGQDDKDELARNAARLDPEAWAGPAVALFIGRIGPEDLADKAVNENPTVQRQQGCEASFYLGEYALLQSRPDDAKRHFRNVLKDCAAYKSNYAYFSQAYGAALEELKRIGG